MRYQVSGIHIDIGDALREHVETELGEAVRKYAERPIDANVIFSKDATEFVCEATIHLSTGLTTQAKGRAFDIYESFDKCREKIEKQMRRYKRRLKDHHKDRASPVEFLSAASYILAGSESDEEEHEPDSLQPIIVAEMKTQIKSLSVGEAVMQMELVGAPVLVFKNERNKGLNVVYRREDGNIGWIDPSDSH
ncbi:MAG: ribosome-associated translation inhibitor RaiA [Rhodobacteraceae bacterium]|nr:ribosome-associated translation inhibitor RaiA [Paracoccaceae bacterium]